MPFMQLQLTPKGAFYACECSKCGATLFTHEWAHGDYNERRDAMKSGTLRCDNCSGHANAETFQKLSNTYAGRYSAPGYLDCTDWEYGTNKSRLERYLRRLYE